MTSWKEERCSGKPLEIQTIAPGLYIQRRNVKEVTHEADEETGAYTEWVCECRTLTESEYEMLKAVEEIDSAKAIDAYTMQLIEEGLL